MYLVRGVKDERIITLEQIEWKEFIQFCKVLMYTIHFYKKYRWFCPSVWWWKMWCGNEKWQVFNSTTLRLIWNYYYYWFKNSSHLHPFDFDAPRSGGIIQIGLKVTKKGGTKWTYISTLSTLMPQAVVASSKTTCNNEETSNGQKSDLDAAAV